MLALNVLDIRRLMAAFLKGTMFDEYLLIEGQIMTFCTFSIDGREEKSFYDGNRDAGADDQGAESGSAGGFSQRDYIRWKAVREHCFDLIKGKRTPLFFKFVFFLPPEEMDALLLKHGLMGMRDQLLGLCLNLRYDGTNLVLTTGSSFRSFTLDRTVDEYWDAYVRNLLVSNNILIEDV